MLYFVYADMALGYLLYAFLAGLGVLQIVAAYYQLNGLAIIEFSRKPRRGYVLGTLLVAGSSVAFFVTQWARVLTPGPAGSELALLFGLGATCAAAAALVTASLRKRSFPTLPTASGEEDGAEVAVGRAPGRLFAPANPGAPMPAVCLIGGPDARYQGALVALARQLVESQMVALLISPEQELFTYPEALAFFPAASALLSKLPEVDPQRVGAVGYGLGGDLVLRAASSDRQLRTAVALAPLLGEPEVGISLLHELAFPEAWRWARDRGRVILQEAISALEYAQNVAPRPLLLVHGANDWLASRMGGLSEADGALQTTLLAQESVVVQEMPNVGHFDLLRDPMALETVVQWLKEHL